MKKEEQEGNGLQELFIKELQDVYDAEHQLTKALPKMAKAAQNEELREAIESHLAETEEQITRLEQVFQSIDEKPKKKHCKGIAGIIEENKETLAENKSSPALDAAIAAAGQKAEHYEIASYGTLCAWAELLGHDEAVDLLKENLEEEKTADEKLTEIAESLANLEAMGQT